MAIELEELFESRTTSVTSNGFTETRNYHVKGEADPSEVILLLQPDLGSAHPIFPNTILTAIKVSPEEAKEVLKVEYTYEDAASGGGGDSAGRNENGETWVFELTSQSQNINSVAYNKVPDVGKEDTYQLMYTGFPAPVPEFSADTLIIGDSEGEPEGIDVYRPYSSIRVNKVFPIAEVNVDFRNTIRATQNTLNKEPWLNGEFAAKEVLFLGANINYDYVAGLATVDYSFLSGKTRATTTVKLLSPTATADNPTFDFPITNVTPFEVLWFKYLNKKGEVPEDRTDPTKGTKFRKFPTHVYRVNPYLKSDFSLLGLVGPD